jgi:hypothetical protein
MIVLWAFQLEEVEEEDKKGSRRLHGGTLHIPIMLISFCFSLYNLAFFLPWYIYKRPIEHKIFLAKYLLDNPSIKDDELGFKGKFHVGFFQTFLKNKIIINFFMHAVFGLMGPLLNPFFHSLHLLLFINISDSAMYILQASFKRFKLLSNTFLVALFTIYSYSTIAASFYSDKFDDESDICKNLASCFFNILNFGLRNGGGVADSMNSYEFGVDSKFGLKLLFDLSFFILINIVILNIVFGVIIDTFGDMRDEAFSRNEKMQNMCLTCLV